MTDRIEIQGKTVDAAVSEALLQLGARRDEVEIKVLEEPKSGFMGFLGGREARVLVRKKQSRRRGTGKDYRVDDKDYKAHTLSGDRSRGGSRRRSSKGSPESRDESRQASHEPNREEKSGSRRGSRGRGGRGRNQEAAGRGPKQNQNQKQGQHQDQSNGRGSRNRRSNVRDNRGSDGSGDTSRDNRNRAPRENNRPAGAARDDSTPRDETPIRSLRRGSTDATDAPKTTATTNTQNVLNVPNVPDVQVSHKEPKPTEQKEKTSVTKPNKPRRSFGGLGSRLKKKHAAAQTETSVAKEPSATPAEGPSPASPAPERTARKRQTPSFTPTHAGEEVVLSGIKGTKYAKALGSVTEEGLDKALTELTDGMLARTGFPCRCETFPGEYRQVKVTTDDDSAGMLIGRHGQTVDAVEHLVERMASNAIDARARINLDINNYRMRREEALGEKVNEVAAQIRETGQPFHVEPMSARERRIVHMHAAELGGLRTFTMDGSGGKHVVIAPEEDVQEKAQDEIQANEAELMVDHQDDSAEEWNNSDT